MMSEIIMMMMKKLLRLDYYDDDRNGWFNSHLYGGVPFSIPLKDCTLIVGSILTLTLWALLLTDFGSAYRRSVGK